MGKQLAFVGVPKGHVMVFERNVQTGKVRTLVEIKNLVVSNFRAQEALSLGGSDLSGRVIDEIQLGTDGTAAAVGNTGLGGSAVTISVSSYSYPATKSVQFEAVLPAASANGTVFQEAGLFHNNGTMAARTTFPSMTKSAMFEWTIRWTLTWS